MAHALSSNVALNLPTSRYLEQWRGRQMKGVKVMVMGDAREKLEHFPKPNKHHHHPLPKNKLAPTAPIGNLSQSLFLLLPIFSQFLIRKSIHGICDDYMLSRISFKHFFYAFLGL